MDKYAEILKKSGKALDRFFYDGELGAVYSKEKTEFRLWSPIADDVRLCLYSRGSDSEPWAILIGTYQMTKDEETGVWRYIAEGDQNGVYYTYKVTCQGFGTRETADIYCRAAGVNGNRSMVVDLKETDPDGWDRDKRVLFEHPTDAIIWEVQVRDFSYCACSGVSEHNRGKFLAFTENTTLRGKQGAEATCVEYLKKLGVNCVQINPFYDFGSVDESSENEQYNWGYDPKNYNVPEGSFSTDPFSGAVRIRECKEMIKALHDAGIAVVMDVVFNHTYENEGSWFDISVPGYYYRYDKSSGWSGGSGCGNDTASEHRMYRRYMVDSVLYWASEYHLDGFRFDLMGLHDVETMNEIRRGLDSLEGGRKILMYGEAWNMPTFAEEGTVMAHQGNMCRMPDTVGAFCDNIRDAIKGSEFDKFSQGFVQKGYRKGELIRGIKGEVGSWARTPSQAVNYASCHDGRTLYDKLCLSVLGDDVDFSLRYDKLVSMNKLSAVIILTSQGIPFMVAGEELARTKLGDHNSYRSHSKINRIDWTRMEDYNDLLEYYKGLIRLRKAVPALRDNTAESVGAMHFYDCDDALIAYTVRNKSTEKWDKLLIILNGSDKEKIFSLSENDLHGWWVAVVDGNRAGTEYLGEYRRSIRIPPTSALVLVPKNCF